MIVIGLTGSIGMGKSTTAAMFADEGVAVFDSDAAVHALYEGEAVPLIAEAFPDAVMDGRVNRGELNRLLRENPANFKVLEQIVHPLVRDRQTRFLEEQRCSGRDFALLDIPLLFETQTQDRVDVVVVVTCDPEIQRSRVLSRPGMTEDKFKMILSRQLPDEEKRERADFVIDTGKGFGEARRQVQQVLATLRGTGNGSHSNA